MRSIQTFTPAVVAALAISGFLLDPVVAQPQPRSAASASRDEVRKDSVLPPIADVVAPAVEELEHELTDLLRRARSIAATDRARHDLRIDLRILRRHLLRFAAERDATDPAAQAALLRAADLADLISAADEYARQAAGKSDAPKAAEALRQFHERTFSLGESPDAMLKGVGTLVLEAMGAHALTLPVMRPAVLPQQIAETRAAGDDAPAGPEPLAALNARLRSLPISVELREQLTRLGNDATALEGAARQRAEEALRQATAVAGGLVRGAGVLPEDRLEIEAKLVDALLLLRDPRLSDLGTTRLAELENYAHLVSTTQDLPAGDDTFARLLAEARQDPQAAPTILAILRSYYEQARRYEAAPDAARVRLLSGAKWSRGVEALRENFDRTQGRIETAARQWGQGGALFSASLEDLSRWTQELERLNDLIVVAANAPMMANELETAAHVTPAGGLEKAAAIALVKAEVSSATPSRDAADAVLRGLLLVHRESRRSADLSDAMREVAATFDRDYAGGGAATLGTRHFELVGVAAKELADDEPLSSEWLQQRLKVFERMNRVADAVLEAQRLDAELQAAGSMTRWADWKLDTAQLLAMYEPYRAALSRAVTQADSAEGEAAWDQFEAESVRMAPMTAFIRNGARYAEVVNGLGPDEKRARIAARVQTPSSNALFAAQRYVSAVIPLWVSVRSDPAADRRVLDEILATLQNDYGYGNVNAD